MSVIDFGDSRFAELPVPIIFSATVTAVRSPSVAGSTVPTTTSLCFVCKFWNSDCVCGIYSNVSLKVERCVCTDDAAVCYELGVSFWYEVPAEPVATVCDPVGVVLGRESSLSMSIDPVHSNCMFVNC